MENILECPICYNGYNMAERLPRQLDCQHSLCSQCLPYIQKEINNTSNTYFECTICKRKTKQRLNDIPRSLLMIQIMDATKYVAKDSTITTYTNNTYNNITQQVQSTAPPRPVAQQPQPMPPMPFIHNYQRYSPSPDYSKLNKNQSNEM